MNYRITKDTIFVYEETKSHHISRRDFLDWAHEGCLLDICIDNFNPSSSMGHCQIEYSISDDDFMETDLTDYLTQYLIDATDSAQQID
jgi:hypothetical protein